MTRVGPTERESSLAAAVERFALQFAGRSRSGQEAGNGEWLRRFQEKALQSFRTVGFPTTRDEEWKFTSLASFAKTEFEPAALGPGTGEQLDWLTKERVQHLTFEGAGCHQLVFLNGRFCPDLSVLHPLPSGVELSSLGLMLWNAPERVRPHLAPGFKREHKAADAFRVLNSIFLENGAFVYLPHGVVVEDPIHLVFLASSAGKSTASHPRNIIIAEYGAIATILESYVALEQEGSHLACLTNAVTEMELGEGAQIDHYKYQYESETAFHVGSFHVSQGRGSKLTSHSLALGGGLVRNDLHVVFDGEAAECTLNGVYATSGSRHVDNHTVVDHAHPRCASRESYKGILDGASRGVFNGKIIVREDAQKSDAQQENKNLLLSDDATVNTKPQLAILADDVKCTHGATIGRLDPEALFYLRSRGIPDGTARSLLTAAFASDIVSRIKVEPLRKKVEAILAQLFAERRPA